MVLPRCGPSLLPLSLVVVLDLAQDIGMEWVRLEHTLGWSSCLGSVVSGIDVVSLVAASGLGYSCGSLLPGPVCHISTTNLWHGVSGTGLLTRLGDRPQTAGDDGSGNSTQVCADSSVCHSTKITPQSPRLSLFARLNLLLRPTTPKHTSINDYWKNHSFEHLDFVSKVILLLFNMLFRFVIAFLPRSKCLLISWLQSPSAVSF